MQQLAHFPNEARLWRRYDHRRRSHRSHRRTCRRPGDGIGIGFVNFGRVGVLQVQAALETSRPGSRGFNVYGATVYTRTRVFGPVLQSAPATSCRSARWGAKQLHLV